MEFAQDLFSSLVFSMYIYSLGDLIQCCEINIIYMIMFSKYITLIQTSSLNYRLM